MKLFLPVPQTPDAGKGFFFTRLYAEFLKKGYCQVVSNPDEFADVSINSIRITHKNSAKKIIRFDGVWHDTNKPWQQRNKTMSDSMRSADGVIYQSCYAKTMCDKYLGKTASPFAVIFNGANPEDYTGVKEKKPTFICFSKWRPHKRLRDIIRSFLAAAIPESTLIIAGDLTRSGMSDAEIKSYFAMSNINYIGKITQEYLKVLLPKMTASIHICSHDACPNTVVESIAAGTPVVCNNIGGTPEIVSACSGGVICPVDAPYDLEPLDLYHQPPIDEKIVSAGLHGLLREPPKIDNTPVHIETIAKKYYEFAKKVCGE